MILSLIEDLSSQSYLFINR